MKEKISKKSIQEIHCREIINSHAEFTAEFIIVLDDRTVGVGSAPHGETVSIYEKDDSSASLRRIIRIFRANRMLNVPLDQAQLDAFLEEHMNVFGRKNCYALSVAFFDATARTWWGPQLADVRSNFLPRICLNFLNGSHHAYTNPVLSDFHEFLLVSKSLNLATVMRDHNILQKRIKKKLTKCDKTVVSGNLVNIVGPSNSDCIELLLNALDELNLASAYELMIDASAGDMWTGKGYRFSLTDKYLRTRTEMCDYWFDLIDKYQVKFLEDPFHEQDLQSWKTLTSKQDQCSIIGNNLYASDPRRVLKGAKKGYTHGLVLMPDQAGTVSATVNTIKVARRCNQTIVASHRSVSTESTFLSRLTNMYQIDHIKIGPLLTDYSAVIRLNELIRLSEIGSA